MDFSFFAHMERIDKSQSQIRLYEEFIELCVIAEKGGFSTIWNGEHHGMNFTIAPNPFTNLVDLSHHTNKYKTWNSDHYCAILASNQVSWRNCNG